MKRNGETYCLNGAQIAFQDMSQSGFKYAYHIKYIILQTLVTKSLAATYNYPSVLIASTHVNVNSLKIKSFFLCLTVFFFSELLSDLLKDRPNEKDGVESIIVVDNIPVVGPDRFEKLQVVILKFFSKFGKIINEYFPKNEAGQTKG